LCWLQDVRRRCRRRCGEQGAGELLRGRGLLHGALRWRHWYRQYNWQHMAASAVVTMLVARRGQVTTGVTAGW